ncbi:glycosyltransferase [Marinobacter sp. SS13-12]|uniref:glycosyltransferase n=1 Tax=Marinobacter sp. SS13-12 TaxID=3050451 RepID=UPI002552B5B7|nr:glycosyltransferase [Marinobacter sp. SS13-12]MDK8464271.1 glycosyltransferase [Marinobacter sp. SS13-12]
MTEEPSTPPITITHIISGDLWAGAEVQVYNLCQALSTRMEVAVTAVIFNPGILHDKLVKLGIPVTLADEASTGTLSIAKAIATHCKMQGTDIVHTHGFKENVLGVLGKELARVRYSVRTVHGNPEHGFSFKKPHKWLTSRLDIWLGRLRQQAVIAVSTQLEQSLQSTFPGKVFKIFNFVNVEEIQQTWRLESNRNKNQEALLGIVGRLVPVKRVDLFIRMIASLNEEGYPCRGAIIGNGPLEEDLKKLALELRVGDRISFKGFVNPAMKEMRKLDALIMPSDHEGLPMTLLEAAALGIPVVAHNVGGIPEVLEDWKRGALVHEQNPSAYSDNVLSVLSRQTQTGDNPPPDFERKFSSRENSKKYVDLYTKILLTPRGVNLPTASS